MKRMPVYFMILALGCVSMAHADAPSATEVERLRGEIEKQEAILKALKTRLRELENNDSEKEKILLHLTPEGIRFQNAFVSEEALLEQLREVPLDTWIHIVADGSLRHNRVLGLLNICEKAGRENVTLALPQGGAPLDGNAKKMSEENGAAVPSSGSE